MAMRKYLPVILATIFSVSAVVFYLIDSPMSILMLAFGMWFAGFTTGLNWNNTKKYVNSILDTPVIKEEKGEQ